jgi:hypothetical protein
MADTKTTLTFLVWVDDEAHELGRIPARTPDWADDVPRLLRLVADEIDFQQRNHSLRLGDKGC